MEVGSTRPRNEDIKGKIRVLRRAIGERDRDAFPAMSLGGGDGGVFILADVLWKSGYIVAGRQSCQFQAHDSK